MKSFPLLEGAIELHAHASPSIYPRKQSDWELIADVKAAGMAGVVIKSHESQSVDRAALLREKEPGLHIYGGLVCNYFTGGLSPIAVEGAIRLGAKTIWMPTISSEQHRSYFTHTHTRLFSTKRPLTQSGKGLGVLDDAGQVRSEVRQILELIASADIMVATGHLSSREVMALATAAFECGVTKVLIQHPDMGIAPIPLDQQIELARQGAFLEKCYLACSVDFNDLTVAQMAKTIEQIGPHSCVMVTDYGQIHNIPVVQALGNFTEQMLACGVSKTAIKQMLVTNPTYLLGL